MKPRLRSKLNWLGILMILASVLADPTFSTLVPSDWLPWILRISGILTVALREVTKQPVGGLLTAPKEGGA